MAGPLAPASWVARPGHALRSWLRLGKPGWVGAIALLHIFAQVALGGVMMVMAYDGAPAFVTERLLLLLIFPLGRAAVQLFELVSSPVGEVLASFVVYALFAANSVLWAFAGAALIRPARRFALRWWLQRLAAAGLVLVPLALVWQRGELRAEVRADWPRFEQRFHGFEGLTEAEVVARAGPPDDTGEDHWDEEAGDWIAYHQERPVYRRGLAVLRLDGGLVASVDLVPGFDIPFEPEDWRRSGPDRRACMANDLIESGRLVGRSRDEVVAVLGPPDPWTRRRPADSTWYLGSERALFYQGLEVVYGDGGLVSSVRLFED